MSVVAFNSCVSCGACCAFYRVSFYWAETDPLLDGNVPVELTEPVNPYKVAMKGTNCPQPRCVALQGEIGVNVSCGIYAQRSSVCRDFPDADSVEDQLALCNRARSAYGLPHLDPPTPLAPTPPPDYEPVPAAV
jgi:Fe-S-cluster containining protein